MEETQVPKRGPGRPPKAVAEPSPQPQQDRADVNNSRIRSLELQLQALTGRRASREEINEQAAAIVQRVREVRETAGRYHWRVHNSRYRDAAGDPVTHDFWSDAGDPESARADYNRRNGRYWSPDEGDDPLKFELISEQ